MPKRAQVGCGGGRCACMCDVRLFGGGADCMLGRRSVAAGADAPECALCACSVGARIAETGAGVLPPRKQAGQTSDSSATIFSGTSGNTHLR